MSSRKRLVGFLVGIVVVVVAAGIGWYYYNKNESLSVASANVSAAPSVISVPGGGAPPASYVQEQNKQNELEVQQAKSAGGSAVPTITRAGFIGSPEYFEQQAKNGSPDKCPIDKVVYMFKPNPASCDVDSLRRAREAGVNAEELRCQACSCPALKEAGFTAGQLAETGLTASKLKDCGFSLADLKAAGFSAKDLKDAGFSAAQLKAAGFSAAQSKDAGFSAKDLKDAGFSAKELKDSGFSPSDVASAGYSPSELSAAGVSASGSASDAKCSVEALKKAREQGVSAADLKSCGVAALKAAGYTAKELKNAGFSAKQLKDAGFSAKALKDAGFSAKQLKDAGFSAGDLKNAGFSAQALKDAGFSAKALRDAGYSAKALKDAGYAPNELKSAGYSKGDLLRAGYSAKEAGYETPETSKAAEDMQQSIQRLRDNANSPAAAGGGAGGSQLPSVSGEGGPSSTANRLAALQKVQEAQMTLQARSDALEQLQGQMSVQAQKLLAGWSNTSKQISAEAIKEKPEAGLGGASGAAGDKAAEATGETVKAGSVLFATLNTGVNTDEKSPIMATIVSGPLRGARLLGSFDRVNTKVVLKFNLLSVPFYPKSVSINVVAIDQQTAHTAVSGNVNKHYLLRYGALFASSFLEGVSQGLMNSASQVNCILGVLCQTQQNRDLSTGESIAVGLGNVGKAYSEKMGESFNVPPTVRIPSGSAIGLLFMSDFTLPVPIPDENVLRATRQLNQGDFYQY